MQKLPIFRAVEMLLVLSVVLFVVGNFTFFAGAKSEKRDEPQKVLGDNTEEGDISEVPEMGIEKEKVEVNIETKVPTSTPNPQKTDEVNVSSDFIYPGASARGGNIYESNDSPDAITDWYKEQIISRNMNVKTFVTTKTNDNVLNKLAGSDGNASIEVEIERKEGESKTKITIKQ